MSVEYGSPQWKAQQTRQANESRKRQHFAEKDRKFADQLASGVWPQDSCDKCAASGACCQRYGHHLHDCCLHCGNDERNIREVKYRGQ